MINKLKQSSFLIIFLLSPLSIFANSGGGGFLTDVKQIVNDYMLPILGFAIVISAGVGLIMNLEDLADRKGEGTRAKALVNIGWIVGIAFVSILAIISIVNYLAQNKIEIQ